MSRLGDWLVLIGAAGVVTGLVLVLGQAQEVQPAPRQSVPPAPLAVKKQAAPPRAAAAQRRIELIPEPVPKEAVAVKAVRVQAQRATLEARLLTQMRSVCHAEYYFIRNACGDLNADQRKALARLGESVARNAARGYAGNEVPVRRTGNYRDDPRKLIEDEFAKAMSGLLSPEQQTRYKEEIAKRAACRKQVVIDNLVAKLDGDLVLSAEQRKRLAEALLTNWNDAWGQSLLMLRNLDNHFPNIPDKVITPILTDNQREVWGRIPRRQNVIYGFSLGGAVMENDPLDDPEVVEAQKEAEAREKK